MSVLRAVRRIACLAVWLVVTSPLVAHELGTVQVRAEFLRDGSYRIDLLVDTEQIPKAPPAGFPAAETALAAWRPADRERVESFLAQLLAGSTFTFDGEPIQPAITVEPTETPLLPVHLTGKIPPGARSARWQNHLPIGSYLTSFQNEGDDARFEWLDNGKPDGTPFELRRDVVPLSRSQVALVYLKLGVTHIVPHGTDHILFVLGISLLSRKLKEILWQVTAFTVAHTITLGLTIYGVVSLSPRIVETAIALSIVYVAIENVLTEKLHAWRVALVFCFGLLHGMGFAGVLRQVGLPRSEFLTGLLSFNAGVEIGQLTVILSAWLVVGLPWSRKPWYRRGVVIPASIAIAVVGLYWAVQRLAS